MIPIHDTVPGRNPPIATWAIILANCGMFLLEISLPEQGAELFYLFGIVPARAPRVGRLRGISRGRLLALPDQHVSARRLVAYPGQHMWTLWIFGNNVEDRMGPGRFLLFYLTCGIAAGVVHLMTNPTSTVPTMGTRARSPG